MRGSIRIWVAKLSDCPRIWMAKQSDCRHGLRYSIGSSWGSNSRVVCYQTNVFPPLPRKFECQDYPWKIRQNSLSIYI